MTRTIIRRVILGALLVGLLMGLTVLVPWAAQTDPSREKTYLSTPQALFRIHWNIGRNVTFQSYSVDVTFHEDVSSSGVWLYFAPIGRGTLSATDFYGGLQTQIPGCRGSGGCQHGLGHGLLFSMWGERRIDAIRPSAGGYYRSSGSEGDYISVRRPYRWTQGTYTYKLVRMDRDIIGCRAYTWVGAFVYSHERNENVFIGALRFKGDRLILEPHLGSFIELYGPRSVTSAIPKLTVTFGNLTVNGKPVTDLRADVHYDVGVPDYTRVDAHGKSVIVKLGQPARNRKYRQVRLIDN